MNWISNSEILIVGLGLMGGSYAKALTRLGYRVAAIDREEYYIRMMQAWYFATALAKQWEATLPVVATLIDWVRRKTIQKACESFRVSDEHKAILNNIK